MKRSANHHAERCRELAIILIVPLREVARRHGYALAVHGSLSYDIDLIACPWRENCSDQKTVAEAIRAAAEAITGSAFVSDSDKSPANKPFGRLAWSYHLGGGPYIDLSVMPPTVIVEEKPA